MTTTIDDTPAPTWPGSTAPILAVTSSDALLIRVCQELAALREALTPTAAPTEIRGD